MRACTLRRVVGYVLTRSSYKQEINTLKPLKTVRFVDKSRLRSLVAKSFEKMGIQGEPIDAEKLQQQIEAQGIKSKDNTFSRTLLGMREE